MKVGRRNQNTSGTTDSSNRLKEAEKIFAMLRLNGERYLVMDEGLPLSPDIIDVLKTRSMRWTLIQGVLFNIDQPYDSRTQEWSQLVDLIISSSYKNEIMGIMINPRRPPLTYDSAPSEIFDHRLDPNNAISGIAESKFCKVVELRYIDILFAKFEPVAKSLPFILGFYNNPASDFFEARYPAGCYITTMGIWFKDWRIRVDLFRQ
jgi:hypothetical protein